VTNVKAQIDLASSITPVLQVHKDLHLSNVLAKRSNSDVTVLAQFPHVSLLINVCLLTTTATTICLRVSLLRHFFSFEKGMSSTASSLSGVAALGGVIAFHEAGHFLAARLQVIHLNRTQRRLDIASLRVLAPLLQTVGFCSISSNSQP
jgi:hypothetical protein